MTQTIAVTPLHLSRLMLRPMHKLAQTDLASPYELHRSIMRAFPEGAPPEATRVLFRVEPAGRDEAAATVLVQSRIAPDWAFLADRPGYCTAPPQHKVLPVAFHVGQLLRFRLRANPVVARKLEGAARLTRGKRTPLVGERACLEWLVRKGEAGGFELAPSTAGQSESPAVRVTDEGKLLSRKDGNVVTHRSALFDGILTVVDTAAFAETLSTGIGPAKGFGFGLLSVAAC